MPILSSPARRGAVALAAVASLLATSHAAAQAPLAPAPTTRFGVMAGVNVADVTDLADSDSRTGFVGGIYLTLPLGSTTSFQPELLFAQRGATARADLDADLPSEIDVKLNYVEVPLLLRVDIPVQSRGIRPHLFAGPSLAFNTACSFEGGGESADCDQELGLFESNTFELGAMIGGGIAFPVMGTRRLGVGVRYTFGLTEVFKNTANVDPRNRTLAVYGTFDVPVGGP